MSLKKNKVLIYTPLLLLAFAISITALLGTSLGTFITLFSELVLWCKGIMLECLSYAVLLKSFSLWAVILLMFSGLTYATSKSVCGLLKSRSSVSKLSLMDKGYSVILVRDYTHSFAFTHGLFNPKIYISTGLIKTLSRTELKNVLLHELHHKKSKDPLRFFIYSFLKDLFFYLPIGGWFLRESITHHELTADEQAQAKTNSPLDLASALVKVTRSANKVQSGIKTPIYASTFGQGQGEKHSTSTSERIERLISGKEKTHTLPLLTVLKSSAIAILLILSTALPLVSTSTAATLGSGCDMNHCDIATHSAAMDCESHCKMKH